MVPATPLDLDQLQAEAHALEQQEAWDPLLKLAQRHRPHFAADQRVSGYLDYLAGRSLVELNAPQQAEPLLRSAAAALPEVPYVHNLLGRALADLEDWLAAAAAQQRCLNLKPDFAYAWLELGRAREALGDADAAVEAFHQALPALPENQWLQQRYQSLRITQLLRVGDGHAAADLIRECQRSWRIPSLQIQDWLQISAALLACGGWEQAVSVAKAIADGAKQGGLPSPLGSRCPLLLQALALLLAPTTSGDRRVDPSALAGALQESLWLPNDSREDALWTSTLASLLTAATEGLTLATTPEDTDLLPLLLALAGLSSSRFRDHQRALALLQVPLSWQGLSEEQLLQCRERCGLTAILAAQASATAMRQLYRQAIRLLQAIPADHRSRRAAVALNQARLTLAGHHLPADLGTVRQLAELAYSGLDQRPISGQLRFDLDQLLGRLSNNVLHATAELAHRAGDIGRAQQLRQQGLDLIAELTSLSLNPPGMAPLPRKMQPAQRWLLLASEDLPQCFLYRVEQKRDQLESLDCEVKVLGVEQLANWGTASALLWADAIVVCRLPGTYPVLRAIGLAQRFGIRVYYDIDDLIFDADHFPPPLATYGGTISAEVHTGLALDAPLFKVAMEQADGLIFSTQTLARRWCELHPTSRQLVTVLPNLAPAALRREASSSKARLEQPDNQQGLRLLVSSGTLAHKQVWTDALAPALAEVMERHPHVQLDLVGSISWPQALALVARGRIRSVPFSDYPTYLQRVGRGHIGLAPLEPGIVTDAKSAIKWMEYSLMGLATVVSPTATYREILQEGQHTLFASDRQGWVDALERLIADPDLRRHLAREAHAHAKELFGPAMGQRFWTELDNRVVQGSTSGDPAAPRRKVLVINCFFAPQSVGGATRVAQNRVRELLAGSATEAPADVTVLCVDLDSWQGTPTPEAMPLDVHQWYGARVIRLGLPPKPWDWHHDDEVEQFCRHLFQRENFDEIEAHSIQILTAAPLRVALDLGIPYRVVLHDGWWLSRLQFLTKDDGTAVDPIDPLNDLEPDAEDAQCQAVIERRNDLMEILDAAEERLAVSESFAELYQRAGVRHMGVRRNQAPEPTSQRTTSATHRPKGEALRFCMVGGMAVHKGYALLRTAIQNAQLGPKALFTVVDHRLKAEEPSYTVTWGGSTVLFIPPVPMDRMQAFYASQDVLIAPSIWPESFGLVTREALAAGLWVIASRAGALAEPIQDGKNGWVVEPGSPQELLTALRKTMLLLGHTNISTEGQLIKL